MRLSRARRRQLSRAKRLRGSVWVFTAGLVLVGAQLGGMISGFLLYGWLPVVVALAVLLAAWLVVWWWTKWREGWVALIGLGLGPAAGLAYDIITASPFCPYGGRFSRPICSPLPSSAPAFALMFAGIALVGVLILLLTRPRGAA